MIGIIQDWLLSQLGIHFNLDKLEEINHFQDGSLFADILTKYGLLNSDFTVNITKGWEEEVCQKNLKLLKPIFDMLNVNYDEFVILDVIRGNKVTILKLLYELYVCLENKQHLYFITQEKFERFKKNHVHSLNKDNIFVSKVQKDKPIKDNDNCLKKSLADNRDLVEWYKTRFKQIEKHLSSRLHQLKEVTSAENNQLSNTYIKQKPCCPCSCSTGAADQELVVHLPDFDMFHKNNEHEKLLDYQQFIALFKAKQQRISAKQSREKYIQNELLQQTWKKVMEKQNEMYNSIFSQILLKQSQYEKQILTKLIQTKKQIKIENNNLIHTTSKILEEEEEKRIGSNFAVKEEFEQLKQIHENEQKRVLELHKMLYKRKQNLTKKKHYELCLDVLDSLIDLSVNASEYQSNYGVPVPKVLWDSWKQYFYKFQPICVPFQTLDRSSSPIENLNYDEIIDFEKKTSAIVNENDIDEYLFTCGRWFYENICKDLGKINENILGFIVHRLLSVKYPPPQPHLRAKLPNFRVAGVLLNFYNLDCIDTLKKLLSKSQIHVFDTETALKSSITTFLEETSNKNDENTPKKSKSAKNDKHENKKNKSGTGSVTSNKNRKREKIASKKKEKDENFETKDDGKWVQNKEGETINLINKETQTSIIDEKPISKPMERSALGLIGEQVFNTLKEGKIVEDDVIVNVIIEYLKTLGDYDGWILLNFPTTINQASIIEQALTGKRLPIEDYLLGNEELVEEETFVDENGPKRKSKILPCPVDEKDASLFKSYFTIFIKANPHTINPYASPVSKDSQDEYLSQKEGITEPNISVKDSDVISPDVLEVFYKDLSIYQNFYCNSYDLEILKNLARIILMNNGLEQTASVDLFGKETLDKLSKNHKKENKPKSLVLNTNKKSEKTKNRQKKLGEKDNNKEEKMLEAEHDINIDTKNGFSDVEKTNNATKESLQSKIVKPGDEEWQFVTLPLINELAVVLATMWENLENCYLQNLENICFVNRLINLRLVPYSTYVKKTVKNVATKPDVRQDLVSQFQKYYMGLDKNLRTLPEVKNLLFCKVLEIQQNIWQIIDDKKNEVESKRKEVINENWLVNELCLLINNYLLLAQTEFDRSVGTYKIVSDYYLTMLEKPSLTILNSQMTNSKINKVTTDDLMYGTYDILEKTMKDSEHISSFSSSYSTQSFKINIIGQNLINCDEEKKVIDITNTFLQREVDRMSNIFQSLTHTFLLQIKAEEDSLASTSKMLPKGKNVTGKGNKSVEKGSEKQKGKIIGKVKKIADNSTDIVKGKYYTTNRTVSDNNIECDKIQQESLLTEWKFVVNTEFERFNLRMNLISSKSQEDIMEFYCYLESVFCKLFSMNLSTYDIDISNTNKLCDYLRTVIEEESLLTHPLVLKRNEFFIDITLNLNKEPKYDEIKELFEQTQDSYFSINQLKKLMGILNIAGPHGVIRKQPFCYILQDLMLFNDKNNQPHLPKIWNNLNESQLLFILEDMFGSEYSINWRDFIIYNLEIPYPSSDEILSLRKQFLSHDLENTEVVSLEVYNSIQLWFEQDLPNNPYEGLRFALIKELLWEMFQVNEKLVNYTALLLYFCKDHDVTIGFKKALCLALGKNVITSKNELDKILQEEAEISALVMNLLDNIINYIVHSKEGTLVYEIFESLSDIGVDYLAETNYNVSEKSESEYGSFDSEKIISKMDDGVKKDNLYDEKQTLTPTVSSPDNCFHNKDKAWTSNIPIATIVSIFNAAFLHQDKTFSLRNQYLNCLEEESDEEGFIEAHVLLKSDCMNKLFKLTNKFKISSPREILEKCLKIEPKLS